MQSKTLQIIIRSLRVTLHNTYDEQVCPTESRVVMEYATYTVPAAVMLSFETVRSVFSLQRRADRIHSYRSQGVSFKPYEKHNVHKAGKGGISRNKG